MKGVSFQNGVEFKVIIEGESWSPEDTLKVTVETKPASSLQVLLVEGVEKKVKSKSADAFVVIEEQTSSQSPFSCQFKLSPDSRITDKNGSLYLLYGKNESIEKLGALKLNIVPHQHLRDLSDLVTMQFRFAQKGISAGKSGYTEMKFDPPDHKDWASLEQLVLFLKLTHHTLESKFQFHRKEIDPGKGGLATRTVKREFTRAWDLKKILHDFNQRLNKESIETEIQKIIAEYREAGWLNQ